MCCCIVLNFLLDLRNWQRQIFSKSELDKINCQELENFV